MVDESQTMNIRFMFNFGWTADHDCIGSCLIVDESQTMIVRFMFNGR